MSIPSKAADAVLELRQRLLAGGFEPIPVAGKAAVAARWTAGEMTPERVAREHVASPGATNTGLRTGRLVGLDVDLTDPDQITAVIEAIEGELGPTFFRRVGAKGCMLCYSNPEPIGKITVATGGGKNAPKVEILGTGQQFVAYGDHPETGKPYVWTNAKGGYEPAAVELWELPSVTPDKLRALAGKLGECLARFHLPSSITVTGDLGERRTAELSPLAGKPLSPEELRERLFRLDAGMTRPEWATVAGGLRATRCTDPDFDKRALFVEWSDTGSNFQDDDDCERVYDDMEPRPGDPKAVGAGTFIRLTNSADYAGDLVMPEGAAALFGEGERTDAGAQDERRSLVDSFRGRKPSEGAKLPPPTYHDAEGLFPKFDGGAVGFVYGPSGAYKSALLLSKLMDLAFKRGVRVAYYAGEGANGVETKRIPAICEALGKTLADLDTVWLTVPRAVDFQNPSTVDALIEAVRDFRPDIIVTDTLASALGGLDENEAKTGSIFTGNGHAYRIARALGATCIYVAHTGKDPKKDIRGSSAFIANTDFALRLTAHRDIAAVDLFVKKMRDGPADFTIQYKIATWGGVPFVRSFTAEERETLAKSDGRYDPIKRDIVDALRKLYAAGCSNPSTRALAFEMVPPIKKGQHDADREKQVEHMARKLEGWVRPNRRTKEPGPLSLYICRDQHNDIVHPLQWDGEAFASNDGDEGDE